jgi:hypothetical protein
MGKRRWHWVRVSGVVAASACATVAVATAVADIPDSGVIHACLNQVGGVRVIDVDQTPSCSAGETALNWAQNGPAGPAGLAGPPGSAGPPGPAELPDLYQAQLPVTGASSGVAFPHPTVSGDPFAHEAGVVGSNVQLTLQLPPGEYELSGYAAISAGIPAQGDCMLLGLDETDRLEPVSFQAGDSVVDSVTHDVSFNGYADVHATQFTSVGSASGPVTFDCSIAVRQHDLPASLALTYMKIIALPVGNVHLSESTSSSPVVSRDHLASGVVAQLRPLTKRQTLFAPPHHMAHK